MIGPERPGVVLEWDSAFFGRRLGRITGRHLDDTSAQAVDRWAREQALDCAYFLAAADDPTTVRTAEAYHYRLVDIRVTLERTAGDGGASKVGSAHVRPATEADLPALKAIGRVSHRDSRFYFDERFPRPLCDALYETWIERSYRGFADALFTAEFADAPVGYVSCHLRPEGLGQIGIIGVSADAQGRGIGRQLVLSALAWFGAQAAPRVTVVTQGRNRAAQRLYQTCGFATDAVELWYHRWFDTRS